VTRGAGDTEQRDLRVAARALARAGLVHAYGHCSRRLDDRTFLVCSAKPMGLIEPGDEGTVVPIDGPLPEGVLGEVVMHQAIYRRRDEVGSVCRIQPRATMALSTLRLTPPARHGPGAYFAPAPPLWDDPALVRTADAADLVATTLGSARAVVLRGNGALTVGSTLVEAVVLAWYLEDAARIELDVRTIDRVGGEAVELTDEEAEVRAIWTGGIAERMWAYLTAGDPEL
jgi:HCOMODA/2-hydroxy-3-carboxy-muconic semialdehyde decarboxylase